MLKLIKKKEVYYSGFISANDYFKFAILKLLNKKKPLETNQEALEFV